jgi:hypothetical protein
MSMPAGPFPEDREARLTLVLNHIWSNDFHSLNSVH